jgi:hypothetical protein
VTAPLIIGIAIGLFAAVIVAGYRHGRTIYTRQLNSLEDAIPEWVNRGQGVWPPIEIDLNGFIDAVDAAIRQQQLEDAAPWN